MVFPGRLSTGCYLCRRRKVKCDGAKPACRRCTTHGTQCPGYPDTFSFRSYKSPVAVTSRKSSILATSGSDPNTNAPRQDDVRKNMPIRKHNHIPTSPEISLDWQAVCYFFHHHVLRVERSPCRGHLVFLPEMYQERGDDPCLRAALLSVSYMALFKSTGVPILQLNAYKYYGAALAGLAKALDSRKLAMREEILVTSLFLGLFKDLGDERNHFLNPHVPGIHSLLQSWEKSQISTKYGREILGWALTRIQIEAMATYQFRYASLPVSIQTMYQPDTVCMAGIITSKISEFCEKATEMRSLSGSQETRTNPNFGSNVASLFSQAANLLQLIGNWEANIPRHWKLQTVIPTSLEDILPTTFIGLSRDPWTTCFLAVFYSAQIYFYLEVLEFSFMSSEFSELMQYHLNKPLSSLTTRIQNLLAKICSTVTHTLGYVDDDRDFKLLGESKLASGHTLSWPLWIVINCGFATAEQTDLCRKALGSIGTTMRFNLAAFLSTAMTTRSARHISRG